MQIESTPIPPDEKLAMLKQDIKPVLRSENRTLGDAIAKAIRLLEASINTHEANRYD